MVDLTSVVGNLQRLGFFDFVLPWLLFFAIILGILVKVKFLGENKKLLSIIAAVIAFFIVNFIPPGGISAFFTTTFGTSGMILATLLVFVLFAGVLGYTPSGLLGGEKGAEKKWTYPILALILIVFAFAVFAQASGGAILSGFGISSDTMTFILVGIFILLVIGFAMGGGKGGKGADESKKPLEAAGPH